MEIGLNYWHKPVAMLTTEYPINITENDRAMLHPREIYENDDTVKQISRVLVLSTFPVILLVGTIGNLLTFIVMQRGSLKHSSTCFYMTMLAVADTCKYSRTIFPIASF